MNHVYKYLGIIFNILFTLLVYIIFKVGSANGYELSIYDAYPIYFWLIIILSLTIAVAILVFTATYQINNYLWKLSYLFINAIIILILLLPYFRGYFLYGRSNSDILFHIALIKYILSHGYISFNNFYPVIHILTVSIVDIGNFSIEKAITLIQILFSLFYISGIFLLTSTFRNKYYSVISIAFATPLLFSYFYLSFHPAVYSLFIIPLFFYSYQQRQGNKSRSQYAVLLLIFTFYLVFFHPSTLLMLIMLLIPVTFYNYHNNNSRDTNSLYDSSCLFIMIVAFFTWYFSFANLVELFKKTINWLWDEIGTPPIYTNTELVQNSGMTTYQFIEYSVKIYGAVGIYNLLFAVGLFILVITYLKSKKSICVGVSQYIVLSITSYLIAFTFLINAFVESEPLRIFRFTIFFITFLNGIIVLSLIQNKTNKFYYSLIIITILSLCITLTTYSVYDSSNTGRANNQLTYMELSGAKWFLSNLDKKIVIISSHLNIYRYETLFSDFLESEDELKVSKGFIPSHFGYETNSSISTALGNDKYYMIITEVDKQFPNIYPPNIREKTNQYNENDFNKLHNDVNVSKIYFNKEFTIYLIN